MSERRRRRWAVGRRWLVRTALVFTAVGLAAASGEDAVRVATFNADNYLVMDRLLEGGRWRPDYPKPESEKRMVRRILAMVDADIVALQELGPRPFLAELRDDLAREEGVDYPYAVHMRGEDPERHLALLSRIEPLEVVRHDDLDFKYLDGRERVKRGMLEVVFPGAGELGRWRLFVVHLKSRWTEHDADPEAARRREREARACRNRILERVAGVASPAYLVAGDFNDHPASAPVRRFLTKGDRRIGSLVDARDTNGEVWTYFYRKRQVYSRVDGFIASPALVSRIRGEEGRIADPPGALKASDHRLVFLELKRP